jgi:hypothetical protein
MLSLDGFNGLHWFQEKDLEFFGKCEERNEMIFQN